jgi:GNAT superfamily N-acetyltransferase
MRPVQSSSDFTVRALTSENWLDMGKVLGVSGDGGCWCMWWHLSDDEFEDGRGEGNKQALQELVDAGKTPGVIAYLNGQPAGWCAVGARSDYLRLMNSGLPAGSDQDNVWSIVCYYVNPRFRGQGLMEHLTRGAVELARTKGIPVVEAYPVESSSSGAYTGIAPVLRKVGFTDFTKKGSRPILRYRVKA